MHRPSSAGRLRRLLRAKPVAPGVAARVHASLAVSSAGRLRRLLGAKRVAPGVAAGVRASLAVHPSLSVRREKAAAALLIAMLVAGILPALQASAAAGPTLRVTAPQLVRAGEPIALDLTVRNAPDLGGFEGTLTFDTDAAYLSSLDGQGDELARLGRGVLRLGPIGRSGSESFGFYLCPGANCVTRKRVAADRAAPAAVTAARLLVTPRVTGRLELVVTGRAVDRAGNRIALAVSTRRIVVQVGGASRLHAAPKVVVARPARAGKPRAKSLDLTRDGTTGNTDAMELVMAWQSARASGQVCGRDAADPHDTNADGCIDIADLQGVANGYTAARRLPRGLPTATWTVDSTSDSNDSNIGNGVCSTSGGICTLRAAIQEANAHAGPDLIQFDIGGSGVRVIQLGSQLPSLSDETGPTTIDGYTQPGAAVNTDPLAFAATIRIEIRGNGERSHHGLAITSANNTIRGLSVYRLPYHIRMTGPGSHHNNIVGNLIGTNVAATFIAPTRVERTGAVHLDTDAHHNFTGRPALEDRNVVSGTSSEGIYLTGAKDNWFYNNIVGLSPNGASRLYNRIHGIDLNFGSTRNIVGGTGPLERNVVGGNHHTGIEVSHGTNTDDNQVIGNYVGTTLDGTSAPAYARNDDWGIHINDGPSGSLVAGNVSGGNVRGGIAVRGYLTERTTVRGNRSGIGPDGSAIPNQLAGIHVSYHAITTTIGPGNILANNPAGVLIDAADSWGNRVTRNSIFNNVNLGIELASPGVNLNDPGDTDVGPNFRLNFPVLALATPDEIRGTACAGCTVEVFIAEPRASDLGAGQYGQGRTFLGSATAGADGWFTIAPQAAVAVGERVTSTAIDADGNTSEFSRNLTVTPAPPAGTYATDTFDRTLSNTWGTADHGGPWSLAGTTADFDVDGSAGTMLLPAANASRAATLFAVDERDVDLSVRIRTGSAFGNAHIYLVGRRSTAASIAEYRARLRVAPDGRVFLAATRVVDGTETRIGNELLVAGLTWAAGEDVSLRAQIAGEEPTRIQIRAWRSVDPEPTGWGLSVTDATASLQLRGAVGVRTYLGGGAASAATTLFFDDFAAVEAPLPPGAPPVAQDAFARTVSNGWGTADVGGAYTVGGGPAADFSVNGSTGTMVVATAGTSRSANLMSVSQLDANATLGFGADSTIQGAHVYVVLRRTISGGTTTEYRARVRVNGGGSLHLLLSRVVSNTETVLAAETLVPGNQATGETVRVRFSVTGTDPTTLRARAWNEGSPEPTGWQLTATDSTAALQAPGAVGLRVYLGSSSTAAPATVRFDDFVVVPPTP